VAPIERDYGELLIARGRPGDADRARELLSDALATAEATGMSGVAERVATLARALGPADAGGQAR
jgi:hypothetical protein